MSNTLVNFKWDDKKDIKWLTDYFSDAKRQAKLNTSMPSIKEMKVGKSQEIFELFFDKLLDGNANDKKLRKNVISAWRSKLKQLQNYKQINIILTISEYEELMRLKKLRGKKSTIKDTILDLIYDEYQIQDEMQTSKKDEMRKEFIREMKNEIQEKEIKKIQNKEIKASRQGDLQSTHIDNILMEKLDILTKDTNAKFELLVLMITKLKIKDEHFVEDEPTCGVKENLGGSQYTTNLDDDHPLSGSTLQPYPNYDGIKLNKKGSEPLINLDFKSREKKIDHIPFNNSANIIANTLDELTSDFIQFD